MPAFPITYTFNPGTPLPLIVLFAGLTLAANLGLWFLLLIAAGIAVHIGWSI